MTEVRGVTGPGASTRNDKAGYLSFEVEQKLQNLQAQSNEHRKQQASGINLNDRFNFTKSLWGSI